MKNSTPGLGVECRMSVLCDFLVSCRRGLPNYICLYARKSFNGMYEIFA